MTYRCRPARTALARDPGHLPMRDRAVLRILNRTGAATVAQLTILAYRNRRLAQANLTKTRAGAKAPDTAGVNAISARPTHLETRASWLYP